MNVKKREQPTLYNPQMPTVSCKSTHNSSNFVTSQAQNQMLFINQLNLSLCINKSIFAKGKRLMYGFHEKNPKSVSCI